MHIQNKELTILDQVTITPFSWSSKIRVLFVEQIHIKDAIISINIANQEKNNKPAGITS